MLVIEPLGQQEKNVSITPFCVSSIQSVPVPQLGLTPSQRRARRAAQRRRTRQRRVARRVTPAPRAAVVPGAGREITHFFDLAKDGVSITIKLYVPRMQNWGIPNPRQKQTHKIYLPRWLYDSIATGARNWIKVKRGGSVYNCPEGGTCKLPDYRGMPAMVKSAAKAVDAAMKSFNYYKGKDMPLIEIIGRKEEFLNLPGRRGDPIAGRVKLFREARAARSKEISVRKKREFEEGQARVRAGRQREQAYRAAPATGRARMTIERRAQDILRQIPEGIETQSAARRRKIKFAVTKAAQEILKESRNLGDLGQYWRRPRTAGGRGAVQRAQAQIRRRLEAERKRRQAQFRAERVRARARIETEKRQRRRSARRAFRARQRPRRGRQRALRRRRSQRASVAYRRRIAERGIKRA